MPDAERVERCERWLDDLRSDCTLAEPSPEYLAEFVEREVRRALAARDAECEALRGLLLEARDCALSCEAFCEQDESEEGAAECRDLIARIDAALKGRGER